MYIILIVGVIDHLLMTIDNVKYHITELLQA